MSDGATPRRGFLAEASMLFGKKGSLKEFGILGALIVIVLAFQLATNGTTLVKTETHEDGKTFTFTAPYVPPAVAVSNANARLKTTLAKGVPKALAAARLRRVQEQQTTNEVSVTVNAGQEAR